MLNKIKFIFTKQNIVFIFHTKEHKVYLYVLIFLKLVEPQSTHDQNFNVIYCENNKHRRCNISLMSGKFLTM